MTLRCETAPAGTTLLKLDIFSHYAYGEALAKGDMGAMIKAPRLWRSPLYDRKGCGGEFRVHRACSLINGHQSPSS